MIDITHALTIPGWMTETELQWLAEQASQHRRIVEIGSYEGRSTRALADNTPGVVYAVDIWADGDWAKEIDWMPDHLKKHDIYKSFQNNLVDAILYGKVVPVPATSMEAALRFAVGQDMMDMVFIDGAHDYESVTADILAWAPLTTDLLCGHDYDHPGVRQAVTELLPNHTTIEGTTIWVSRR